MALLPGNKLTLIPPPTQGLNYLDPLINMDDRYALEMVNISPQERQSSSRQGVETLAFSFALPRTTGVLAGLTKADGTFVMLMICGNTTLATYSITTAGVFNLVAANGCPYLWCEFRNRIFMVTSTLTPRDWDGTTYNATAWVTPGGFALTELSNVWAYKKRLYFTRSSTTNNTSIYYGIIDGIAGVLTELPLASLWLQGGNSLLGGTFSATPGATSQEYNVVVSTKGEVLVFSGDDPAASDWRLEGRFFVAPPAYSGSFFNLEGDFYIVTREGTISCRDLMVYGAEKAKANSITKYIDPAVSSIINVGLSSFFSLRAAISPREGYLYFLAVGGPSTSLGFFVQNLTTKAWSFYSPPTTLTLLSSIATDGSNAYYLASASGVSYLVKIANQTGSDYINGNATPISWTLKHVFINNNQINNKKFNKIRPMLDYEASPSIGSYVDFEAIELSQTVAMTPNALNKKYYDINREGVFISVRISGSTDSVSAASYHGSLLSYQPGNDAP